MNIRAVKNFLRDLVASQRCWLRSWQRCYLYPLCGLLLAQGAPAGLLLTRLWAAKSFFSPQWLATELASDSGAYLYLFLSTTLIFVTLGFLVGSQEDRLRRLAVTDALTGLRNRRYFSGRLSEELARAKRYHTPLSLLILDLDWLKTINDGYGHAAGDHAIMAVANSLESTLRTTDIAARYAGDEFAALLPQTTAEEAMGLANRIVTQVRLASYEHSHIPLSVSIGVADLEGSLSDRPEDLFAAADEALYIAKSNGRDSVIAAPKIKRLRVLPKTAEAS